MTTQTNGQALVGRGNKEGGRLFREWYQDITMAAERGEHAAYVFVMGSMTDILRAFDFHTVFPEINSLQTAVRHTAQEYLGAAEDYGYSPDICGYVKADVGVQLKGGEHPMGRIPRPSLVLATNACNTYVKWAEIWERMYDVPVFTLDVPGSRSALSAYHGSRPGSADFERDRRYVAQQIRELITMCEEITGIDFDIDKLREVMRHTNEMSKYYSRVIELNKSTPAIFNALTEGTIYLGVANALRSTQEGSTYFKELAEEMEYKAAEGIGTLPEEKHRLIFVGVPCYPIFRRFFELFSEWGGVYVSSTYLWFASGGLNLHFEYDLENPIDSLAAGTLLSVRHAMDGMFFQDRALVDMVDTFGADGIVFHPIKSCRTVSTGLADTRRAVMEESDAMTLFIESDMMDKRVVSEAQLKNRIDAFFEGLASKKLRAQSAA